MIIHGMAQSAWLDVAKGLGYKIALGRVSTATRKDGTLVGEMDSKSNWLDTGGGEPDMSKVDTARER